MNAGALGDNRVVLFPIQHPKKKNNNKAQREKKGKGKGNISFSLLRISATERRGREDAERKYRCTSGALRFVLLQAQAIY